MSFPPAQSPVFGPAPIKHRPAIALLFARISTPRPSTRMCPVPPQTLHRPIGTRSPLQSHPPAPLQHSVSHCPLSQHGHRFKAGGGGSVRLVSWIRVSISFAAARSNSARSGRWQSSASARRAVTRFNPVGVIVVMLLSVNQASTLSHECSPLIESARSNPLSSATHLPPGCQATSVRT